MSEETKLALMEAAASSAMEGLPLSEAKLHTIEEILEGKITLQDYFSTLQATQRGA